MATKYYAVKIFNFMTAGFIIAVNHFHIETIDIFLMFTLKFLKNISWETDIIISISL